MLTIYIIAAAVGGALVLLSAIGGGGEGAEHEVEGGEAHAELDTGADHDHDGGSDQASDHEGDWSWMSFFGMRFWSYFSGFFGLTGVLLTMLTDLAVPLVAGGAALLGLFSGFGVSTATRLLTKTQTSSAVEGRDLIGAEGTVLVTVRKETPGKVRISAKGEVLDLQAITSDPTPLAVGREVVIVASQNHRVTVVPKETLLLESKTRTSEPVGG